MIREDIIKAAARDADVIYIALFRKWYADGDFDEDHPLALPLNFPNELPELERRSRDAKDEAMQHPVMQKFLATSGTAPALLRSAPVQDPAAAGPSGSGPSRFAQPIGDEEARVALRGGHPATETKRP